MVRRAQGYDHRSATAESFGMLAIKRGGAMCFEVKLHGIGYWIHGGYFVVDPSRINLVDLDQCTWEK